MFPATDNRFGWYGYGHAALVDGCEFLKQVNAFRLVWVTVVRLASSPSPSPIRRQLIELLHFTEESKTKCDGQRLRRKNNGGMVVQNCDVSKPYLIMPYYVWDKRDTIVVIVEVESAREEYLIATPDKLQTATQNKTKMCIFTN